MGCYHKVKYIHPEAAEYCLSKIFDNQYKQVYKLYLDGLDQDSISILTGYSKRQIERIIPEINIELVIMLSEQIVGCNIRPITVNGIEGQKNEKRFWRLKAWAG